MAKVPGKPPAVPEVVRGELVPTSSGPAGGSLDRWKRPPDAKSRWERVIEYWKKTKKPTTVRAYAWDIGLFQRYLKVETPAQALMFLLEDQGRANEIVIDFIEYLQTEYENSKTGEKGLHSATIQRCLSSLKSSARIARMIGITSVTIDVPSPKVFKYRDTKGPTDEIVIKILAHYERRLKEEKDQHEIFRLLRDRAIIWLMLVEGIRRGEIASLETKHVSLENRTIEVLSKGKRERDFIKLPVQTFRRLKEWYSERVSAYGLEGPLFTGRYSKGITGNGIWFIVQELAEEIGGAELNLAPHKFRHHAITQVAKKKNIVDAAAFARHSDTATTLRYIDNLEERGAAAAQEIEESLESRLKEELSKETT